MMQRIQSIFLLLVTISLASTFFFPLWQKLHYEIENNQTNIKEIETLYIYELVYEKKNTNEGNSKILTRKSHIIILIFIGIVLSFYSIFQYKNRLQQIKIGAVNSLVMSLSICVILYELFYVNGTIKNDYDINILISFYLILAALIFNSLANRFIRKDEILVNESDRIR